MLWVAVAEPFDVTEPARVWAELIGLDDPEGRGAARVNAAIRKLTEDQFLRVQRKPGMPSHVFLMNETGNGEEYTKPSDFWGPGGASSGEQPKERYQYTAVPSELWTNGWISLMSGPALTMFLAVLQQSNRQRRQAPPDRLLLRPERRGQTIRPHRRHAQQGPARAPRTQPHRHRPQSDRPPNSRQHSSPQHLHAQHRPTRGEP
jgi:hypothetical protein